MDLFSRPVQAEVQFTGIKLDDESGGAGASVWEGFQEAVNHDPQIISVSLGYDLANQSTRGHFTTLPNALRPLEAEIQRAVDDGIVVVFSAGGIDVDRAGAMPASSYASVFRSQIYPGRQQILRRTARDVVNGTASVASNEGTAVPAAPGSNDATGTGLVDAFAALRQIELNIAVLDSAQRLTQG